MRHWFWLLVILVGCAQYSNLEQSVIDRALSSPASAEAYFLDKIEDGATVEEQAVYLYGMGLAYEKLGNHEEAVSSYLSAEALGYKPAAAMLEKRQ